jgi:N-carbamoylputrescine amidase
VRLTICELSDDATGFARDWARLVEHVRAAQSELVLLPEMPFHPWFGIAANFAAATWREAVRAHEAGLSRLDELAPAIVVALTSPSNPFATVDVDLALAEQAKTTYPRYVF